MPRPFLTAAWHDLVMLNYEIDPAVLTPFLPAGCELDVWGGRHCVSVVGFWFLNTRVLGVPALFHRNFEEINLRFYVRRRAADEVRRGVVFVKEVVPRRAIAAVARWVYNENYVYCPTASNLKKPTASDPAGSVAYRWKTEAGWAEVAAEIHGEPSPLTAGSEEEFITEHYWGYARQRDGGTVEYQVQHPSWRVWRATSSRLTCDVRGFYGNGFAAALNATPTSAFVAEGSDVAVMRGVSGYESALAGRASDGCSDDDLARCTVACASG